MTKTEVLRFLNRIKAYYYNFSLEDIVKDEWVDKLKPYGKEDVEAKFEEHLKGEYALEPPKLHFLTRYLKTEEEKARTSDDYLIRCNLCGNEMYLSEYEKNHHAKCLVIKALLPILQKKGDDVNYEILNEYDLNTLERIFNKYFKPTKDLKVALNFGGKNE